MTVAAVAAMTTEAAEAVTAEAATAVASAAVTTSASASAARERVIAMEARVMNREPGIMVCGFGHEHEGVVHGRFFLLLFRVAPQRLRR